MITDKDRDAALEFYKQGYYDDDRTSTSGRAYFLAQIIGDVDGAFDGLVRDFRAGRFEPGGWPAADDFKERVRAERDRQDQNLEYEQLQSAFADGYVEQHMDTLAEAFDTFETGRAQAFKDPAEGAGIAVRRQVAEFRGDLTLRGTGGLAYVVEALWTGVLDKLVLLGSEDVRRYATHGRDTDPTTAIATLSGAPVIEVRTRLNRGSSVRRLSESLVRVVLSDWTTTTDAELITACEPLADWPREAGRAPAVATDNGCIDDGEAARLRIQRRNASWQTLS